MSGRKKIIITITGVLLCIIAIIGYNYIHRQLLRKKGFVGAEMVRIEDVNYRYTSFELSKEGNVSCAYIGSMMERTTDKEILQALTEILQNDYTDGTPIFLSNHKDEKGNFKHIVVGYEDCPVGTDRSIYYIGEIDSKWVIIFRNELGEWEDDELPAVYYELDPAYGKIFEKSGFWD